MSDTPKSRIDKIKNSPAAKQLKEEGPAKVAKTLAGFAKEGIHNLSDKVMDAVAPLDNTHMQTRQQHFNEGVGEKHKMLEEDVEKFHNFHDRGIGLGSQGNVTSIVNGITIRGEKAARRPEGY